MNSSSECRFSVIILIGIYIISSVQADVCEDPNEEFTNCGNHCTERCFDGRSLICTLDCKTGCFCKTGFNRHPNGTCVLSNRCPPVCNDPNEEWKEGNACTEACDRAVRLCTYGMYLGCHCKEGYLRDPKTGVCVPECQCPVVGSDNFCHYTQVYKCGNDCWDYCDDGSLRKCSGNCTYGCYCKSGYKLHPDTHECVLSEECPCSYDTPIRCTGLYETFMSNGSACQDTCHKHLVRCMDDRKPGCYCIDGYARDIKTGVCRPYPCQDCGTNAEWVNCAGPCDNHCDFVLGRDTCKIQHIRCPDACRCKKGYARASSDPNSMCIKEESCSLYNETAECSQERGKGLVHIDRICNTEDPEQNKKKKIFLSILYQFIKFFQSVNSSYDIKSNKYME